MDLQDRVKRLEVLLDKLMAENPELMKDESKKLCPHLEWKYSNQAQKMRLFFTNGGHGNAICDGWTCCPVCGMTI
jgi:hypothetical protein